jgi:16S rRNA C1402 (ribose-2'-O) methylase RsmI
VLARSADEGFDWAAEAVLKAPDLVAAEEGRRNTVGYLSNYEIALALAAYGHGDDARAARWLKEVGADRAVTGTVWRGWAEQLLARLTPCGEGER